MFSRSQTGQRGPFDRGKRDGGVNFSAMLGPLPGEPRQSGQGSIRGAENHRTSHVPSHVGHGPLADRNAASAARAMLIRSARVLAEITPESAAASTAHGTDPRSNISR
jgi:hypothetical protein